jgi:hypothetical protein
VTPRIPPPTLRTPAATAPAAAGRALQLARVGYGTALVLAPGVVIFLATGRPPGRRTRWVARLLGARHLAQAALTAVAPLPEVFTMGAQADALHAASMVLLATVDRPARQAALTDAVAEAVFAAVGFSAPVEAPEGDLVQQQPERGRRRDRHQGADDAHQGPADQHGHN